VSETDRSGDRARRELLLEEESFREYVFRGLGDNSVGLSVSGGSGVSGFGVNAPGGIAFGGRAGSDLSTCTESFSLAFICAAAALDFFRLLAISDSWQLIQNMPCDVLA
jgi:hypothetical protein